jgi:septum formation protein
MTAELSQAHGNFRVVLASASPRRREILANAGFQYEIVAADIDESLVPSESPEQSVRRLSLAKTQATLSKINRDDGKVHLRSWPVLGADTIVTVDGKILGKPSSAADAREMLRRLAGRAHEVLTGIACSFPSQSSEPEIDVQVSITRVFFRPMTDVQIELYVATGEPFDKAGGYGIQGLASKYVRRIEGCYFNVVGLPISLFQEMLEKHGHHL